MRSVIGLAVRNGAVVLRVAAREVSGVSVVAVAGGGIRQELARTVAVERSLVHLLLVKDGLLTTNVTG